MEKPVYCIRTTEETSTSGYFHRHIHFRACEPENISLLAQLCVNNRAGYYGGDGIAADMLAKYESLMKDGYRHLDQNWSTDHKITISFQRYEQGQDGKPDTWCDARFDVSNESRTILWGADLIRRIRKEDRAFGTPDAAMLALADMFPTYHVKYLREHGGHTVITGAASVRPAHVRALRAAEESAWRRQRETLNRKIAREEEAAEKLQAETAPEPAETAAVVH